MSNFWTSLIAGFEAALPVIEQDVKIAAPMIAEGAKVASVVFPQSAPVIAEGAQIVSTVAQLAPGAQQTASSAVDEIKTIIAAGSDEVKRLGELFGALGHVHAAGQVMVVAPKVTGATQPVSAVPITPVPNPMAGGLTPPPAGALS